MKILSAQETISIIVETDNEEWPEFRRGGPDCWENRMGESWEAVYDCEKLEQAYQEWVQLTSPDMALAMVMAIANE